MSIRYVTYPEINKLKWDTCIRNSFNGLIYGYSWFLDIMCESWDALIENDYERIMPLPYKTSWVLERIYQPLFINQLGIFSVPRLTPAKTNEFLSNIPERFKLSRYNLNKFNSASHVQSRYRQKKIAGYGLDLISDYEMLSQSFTEHTSAQLESAKGNNLQLKSDATIADFITFYRHYGQKMDQFSMMRLKSLLTTLKNLNVGELIGVYNAENRLVAIGFFVSYINNASLLVHAESPKGKELSALHWMIDNFLKSNARKNVTLDFPDVKSTEQETFYTGFGCTRNDITQVQMNNLPVPIKYLFP